MRELLEFRTMWTLVRSQFRYHAAWMAPLLLMVVAIAAVLTVVVESVERIADVWSMCNFGFGIFAHVVVYYRDVRERRPLLWIQMPVTPRQVIGARLMIPLLLHSSGLVIGLLGIALLAPFALTAETVFEILAINGLFMMLSSMFYLGEELGVRLAGNRWALWLYQAVFVLFIFILTLDPFDIVPDLETTAGVLGLHALAGASALAAYRMFQNRTNFLMGTDPNCGLPVDWSRVG